MQPVLDLTNPQDFEFNEHTHGKNVTPTRKAYILDFENPRGGVPVRTWVAVSQSKIENGKLLVAEWLLEPRREGIGSLLKAGYKCLMGEVVPTEKLDTMADRPAMKSGVINKGFFTVEGGDDKHRTFRFKTNAKGQTLIGLMVGQNNVTDYAWFGFVDGEIIRFWRNARYQQSIVNLPISHTEIEQCFSAIRGNVEGAGLRFATYYKNCSRCGKVLTTPESLARGLGAECAGLKYGAGVKKDARKAFNDLYHATAK